MWKSFLLGILFGLPILGAVFYFVLLPKLQNPPINPPTQAVITPAPKKTSNFPKITKVLDCDQDFGCFIQTSAECKPAKMQSTKSLDIFGVTETATSYWEIKGEEAGKCLFYLQTKKIDLKFPPNTPQKQIDEQNKAYDKLEGRDGTCQFENSDLIAMLTRWQKGTFDSGKTSCELSPQGNDCKTTGGDFAQATCQGSYFSNSL